jgi:hypothetical protein
VLLGDGECAEGSVWEAASLAGVYQLNNLVAVVDVNRLGQSQPTAFEHNLDIYKRRFEAFGWRTEEIDGHEHRRSARSARSCRSWQPALGDPGQDPKGRWHFIHSGQRWLAWPRIDKRGSNTRGCGVATERAFRHWTAHPSAKSIATTKE